MASSDRRNLRGQEGYTLAALLVILTVLAVVIAYSVPPLWSTIMQREREKHTIWVMQQYARSIQEFQRKRGTFPVSLDQIVEQKNPRVLRQLYANPLSGEVDWILVPVGTPSPAQSGQAAPGQPQAPSPATPAPPPAPAGGPGSQVGPFIGVRLPQSGDSFLELNGASRYEEWMYTINELQRDQGGGTGQIPFQSVPQGPQPSPPPAP